MKSLSDYGIVAKNTLGWHKVLCPKCSHTRKKNKEACLRVNTQEMAWRCFNCGFNGNLKNGHQKTAGEFKVMRNYDPPPRDNTPLRIPESENMTFSYLKGRGIPEEIQKGYKINISGSGEIMFPYMRNGKTYNFKYRGEGKKFRMEPGKDLFLWNEDALKGAKTVCITEGEIDALSFITAGFESTVSIPNGGSTGNVKMDYLQWVEKELSNVDEFILAMDGDSVGQNMAEELARRLGKGRCVKVEYPQGCKDANEVLVKYGAEGVMGLVNSAKPYPLYGFLTARDVKDGLDKLRAGEIRRGLHTGLDNIKANYTVQKGEWTLITGIPSHGKSTFLDQLVVNMAKRHDWRIGLFSPENIPHEVHFAKLISKWASKPFRGNSSGVMTNNEYEQAREEVSEYFFKYSSENSTLDHILDISKQLVYRFGIEGVVIDPWNTIDHDQDYRMPETEYISKAINKIKRFCAEFNVHIWLVAHPTKLKENERKVDGVKQTYYMPPKPYNIAGSAHWMNKGDNCITVYRSLDLKNITEIHFDKIRHRDTGKPGVAHLYYREDDETFHDASNWER